MKTTPKDFFLNLGSIIALYISVGSLLTLAFNVINTAFPAYDVYDYYRSFSISWPVATLIVVFPLFILFSWLLQKDFVLDPMKKDLGVRKWLAYITLFLAGAAFATDLIVLLYTFLNGEIITTAFVLKVIAVLVVSIAVFSYYILGLRDRLTSSTRKIYAVVSTIVILGMIFAGFSIIGSPRTQRLARIDNDRLSDLQNIQWQILNRWQLKQVLPPNLEALRDSFSNYTAPNDPATGKPYEYRSLGGTKFELCATFDLKNDKPSSVPYGYPYYGVEGPTNDRADTKFDSWAHDAGRVCFERTIDSELYPPVKTLKQGVQ